MKKNIYVFICLLFVVFLVACNNGEPISVSFTDITGAGSTDNTFVATFLEEKEYKNRSCDLLVMGEIDGLTLKIAKENNNFVTIVLPNKEVWYSITSLISSGQGNGGQEEYALYSETSSLTYIVRSNINTKIKVKAVVGTIEESAEGGELLVHRQDASKEFEFELKKYEEK